MTAAARNVEPADDGSPVDIADYCRRIETYLCQKNEGHLIRIVGPSFDLVSCWAVEGIPLKIGPRRRPVRIDFCAADVRDAFDDWRRATGVTAAQEEEGAEDAPVRRTPSLTDHLTRVIARLTDVRVAGILGEDADVLIDRLSAELTRAKASPRGLRGEAREAMRTRLETEDQALLALARASLGSSLDELRQAAEAELEPFLAQLAPEALARARELATARLIRERCRLPVISLT
jgi:hypothetical protein